MKPRKAKTSITENIEQIKMSRFLSEIKTDVPIEYNIEDAKAGDFFNENSYELFKKYNFKNMLKKFENTDITAKDPDCYESRRYLTLQKLKMYLIKRHRLLMELKKSDFQL